MLRIKRPHGSEIFKATLTSASNGVLNGDVIRQVSFENLQSLMLKFNRIRSSNSSNYEVVFLQRKFSQNFSGRSCSAKCKLLENYENEAGLLK